MARRRNRRRNPIRTTGALVINPRRSNRRRNRRTRNRRTNRKTNRRRNAKRSKASYRKAALKGWRKRRNPGRRRNTRRRNTRRRNSKLTIKRRFNRRRKATKRRTRKAPVVRYRYRNRRRNGRRRNTRRRNPGMVTSLQRMVNKIPVVGGLLSSMVGFAAPAVAGAVMVEPAMLLAKFVGPYVPMVSTPLFYAGIGLVLGALVMRFAPLSPANKRLLATSVASGMGAIAYYKWRMGEDSVVAEEAGMLEMRGVGAWADGLAYSVQPYGAWVYGR